MNEVKIYSKDETGFNEVKATMAEIGIPKIDMISEEDALDILTNRLAYSLKDQR